MNILELQMVLSCVLLAVLITIGIYNACHWCWGKHVAPRRCDEAHRDVEHSCGVAKCRYNKHCHLANKEHCNRGYYKD